MTTFETTTCSSCPAQIIWASTTATGRPMPVDAEPHEDGTVLLHPRDGRGPLAEVVPVGSQTLLGDVEPLRQSHFSTCPQADEHRRPR